MEDQTMTTHEVYLELLAVLCDLPGVNMADVHDRARNFAQSMGGVEVLP